MSKNSPRRGSVVSKMLLSAPTTVVIRAINEAVKILWDRGYPIKDWDDKSRTLHSIAFPGNKAVALFRTPYQAPESEVSNDGQEQPG